MTKSDFLHRLRQGLSGLPQSDVDGRIMFYSEMIEDRIEEGMSEEEAVAGVGSIDDIIADAVGDTPLSRIVKEKVRPKRDMRGWETALIVLGFPLWFSLLISLSAIILSVYIIILSLILVIWVVEFSFFAASLAGAALSVVYFIHGSPIAAIAAIGVGAFSAGITVFLFLGCISATKGVWSLTGKFGRWLKNLVIGRNGK